jgi:hypothetical protein
VLIDFLCANAEVFAWSPSDMPGIPRDVAEHSLDIRAGVRPVKQPLRQFDEEKRRAIGEEIHKLMAAGFIKDVCRLHWSKQSMSESSLPSASHRSNRGFHCWVRNLVIP